MYFSPPNIVHSSIFFYLAGNYLGPFLPAPSQVQVHQKRCGQRRPAQAAIQGQGHSTRGRGCHVLHLWTLG